MHWIQYWPSRPRELEHSAAAFTDCAALEAEAEQLGANGAFSSGWPREATANCVGHTAFNLSLSSQLESLQHVVCSASYEMSSVILNLTRSVRYRIIDGERLW